MVQLAAAAIEIATVGATVVLAFRSRREANACPVVCLVGLTVVVAMTFGLAAAGRPGWLAPVGAACAGAILAAWFAALVVARRSDDGGDDGGGGGGGGGGGPEQPPPSYDEPWWWGDFERQLRAYTRRTAIRR